MNISAQEVQELRQRTGAGVMEAKKALLDSRGDIESAIEVLRKEGFEKAARKSDRETREGLVESYIHATGKMGVLLMLYSETDFVARNEKFKELAHELALHIAGMYPKDIDELLLQPFVKDADKTVKDVINEYIVLLGENIQVGDFTRYEL